MTLNFGLATIYQSIYKRALLDFLEALSFQECNASGLPSSVSNFLNDRHFQTKAAIKNLPALVCSIIITG